MRHFFWARNLGEQTVWTHHQSRRESTARRATYLISAKLRQHSVTRFENFRYTLFVSNLSSIAIYTMIPHPHQSLFMITSKRPHFGIIFQLIRPNPLHKWIMYAMTTIFYMLGMVIRAAVVTWANDSRSVIDLESVWNQAAPKYSSRLRLMRPCQSPGPIQVPFYPNDGDKVE